MPDYPYLVTHHESQASLERQAAEATAKLKDHLENDPKTKEVLRLKEMEKQLRGENKLFDTQLKGIKGDAATMAVELEV